MNSSPIFRLADFHRTTRIRFFFLHLAATLTASFISAILVFLIWYPGFYRELSGGTFLFWLLIGVDVVMGPVLGVIVFNSCKAKKELISDLFVIVVLQLTALGYGLSIMYNARPVYLVYEYNRFQVVHAMDLYEHTLQLAPEIWQTAPVFGPELLSLRPFNSIEEKNKSIQDAIFTGGTQAAQPNLWQSYGNASELIRKEMKSIENLHARFPKKIALIDATIKTTGKSSSSLAWLGLISKSEAWTALVDVETLQPIAVIAIDSSE